MNHLKRIGVAVGAAMVIAAAIAGTASATTLEVGGVAQSGAVAITASAPAVLNLAKTDGELVNACTESSFQGTTKVFSGARVTGSVSVLSFKTCTGEPVVVDSAGGFIVEHESGSTSGNLFSEGASVTVPTALGVSVTCTTAASGTKIGTLTGVAAPSSHPTIAISAVLSCGFLLPSATLKGTYKVSSPTGGGVIA